MSNFLQIVLFLSLVACIQAKLVYQSSREGEPCKNECAFHEGKDYQWCKTTFVFLIHDGWDWCSTKTGYSSKGCKCTNECDFHGESYRNCYTIPPCADMVDKCGLIEGTPDPGEEDPNPDSNVIVVYDPPTEITAPA